MRHDEHAFDDAMNVLLVAGFAFATAAVIHAAFARPWSVIGVLAYGLLVGVEFGGRLERWASTESDDEGDA